MILSKVYEDAERKLKRNEITLGEFERLVDIEVEKVVYCKECKHNYNEALNHGKMQPRCDFADWKLSENDYCSRGERKEP